jgi:hypothetical protein
MAGVTIREATPEDIPELARLRWDFKVELGDVNPVMEFEPFAHRFTVFAAEALADPRWRAFVAEAGGHLVGNLWIQLVPKVTWPSDRSRPFYDRAGFRPAEDSMSRRLRPEPYGAWPVAE